MRNSVNGETDHVAVHARIKANERNGSCLVGTGAAVLLAGCLPPAKVHMCVIKVQVVHRYIANMKEMEITNDSVMLTDRFQSISDAGILRPPNAMVLGISAQAHVLIRAHGLLNFST